MPFHTGSSLGFWALVRGMVLCSCLEGVRGHEVVTTALVVLFLVPWTAWNLAVWACSWSNGALELAGALWRSLAGRKAERDEELGTAFQVH